MPLDFCCFLHLQQKIFPLVLLFSGPEMRNRIEVSSESSGGWGWGAAYPQTDGHGGKWTSADGGGGSAARQCCQRRGSNRIEGGRQWVKKCMPVWKSHMIVAESYWVSMLPSCHCLFAARAQAAELRFSQLKERHAELITSHADLMKKVNCPQYCFFSTPIQKNVGNTCPHCLQQVNWTSSRVILTFCGLFSVSTECRHSEDAVKYKTGPRWSAES